MSLPNVVSPEAWRAARVELLAEEKELTRSRDALNVKRRELPMVKLAVGTRPLVPPIDTSEPCASLSNGQAPRASRTWAKSLSA